LRRAYGAPDQSRHRATFEVDCPELSRGVARTMRQSCSKLPCLASDDEPAARMLEENGIANRRHGLREGHRRARRRRASFPPILPLGNLAGGPTSGVGSRRSPRCVRSSTHLRRARRRNRRRDG
jgi:hypothetical protein